MNTKITGYIAAGGLGTIFTIPVWEKMEVAFMLGAAGALGGLVVKLIWNLIRNSRKGKNNTHGKD